MAVDGPGGAGTPVGEGSNAADIFRSDAGHLQRHVQQAQRRRDGASGRSHLEADGVVRFMYGPVVGPGGYQLPQVEVEVERFTGIRLGMFGLILGPTLYPYELGLYADAYLPNKPGFAFNAGGPVWGLDWCPQPDDDVPACMFKAMVYLQKTLLIVLVYSLRVFSRLYGIGTVLLSLSHSATSRRLPKHDPNLVARYFYRRRLRNINATEERQGHALRPGTLDGLRDHSAEVVSAWWYIGK